MDRKTIIAALAPALMLAACGGTDGASNETASGRPADAPNAMAAPAPGPAPGTAPANAAAGATDGAPDRGPPALTPEAERGVEGARNLLLTFARAIERKDFAAAWSLLSPADRQRWSRPDFAAMFADLEGIAVAVPDGMMEGAAGSSFYAAPVTISGRDPAGRPIRFEGRATLRRVNDVPGATPAQLRWHFETLTLDWTH